MATEERDSPAREAEPAAQDGSAGADADEQPGGGRSSDEQKRSAGSDVGDKTQDRRARFEALQARQAQSRKQNLKDTAVEKQRQATDPGAVAALKRRRDVAAYKLLKADSEAAGEDFERKRAWDWTIDEAEKWDRRVEKKGRHREAVAFQDYRHDAEKVYKRQLRELQPDTDAYERQKMQAIERCARRGGLEIVETDAGELLAIDKDGSFYSTADSTDFVHSKPDRAAVDRLVADIRKAEEIRLKKRKERGRVDDDADVTYINEKNKQFNEKLARFYNKYTADIRESFERGTAI